MRRRFLAFSEPLERRVFLSGDPAPPDLSPLSIPNLVFSNGVFTATNPTISVQGTPTISLQGTVTVAGGNITADGQVRAAFGGNQLLFGGSFTIPIGSAATSALSDTLANVADRLQLAGTQLQFQNLLLTAGAVQFDARATLPAALGSYELSATQVSFGASGITAATLGISDPSVYRLDLGGFALHAQQLSATYEVPAGRIRFNGQFAAPQLSTTVDLTGSRFLAVGAGPTIEFAGGVSINGPVTIGGPWKLNSLDLQINYQNGSFSTSGTGVLDTGGGTLHLQAQFQNSAFTFTASGGATFDLLGMRFTLSSFRFTSDQSAPEGWDPLIEIEGSLQLPPQFGNFTVAVQNPNVLRIDSTGVSLTGAALSLPGNQTFTLLGLIELKTQNATLSFDFSRSEMKLQGTCTIPTLDNLQINLSGSNFAALKFDNGLDFAMQASFTDIHLPIFGAWQLHNGSVTINKPYGVVPGDISGSFQIRTPNNTTIAVGLAFENGRLTQVTATNNNPSPDFTFFGVSGRISSLKFIPDIHPGNADDFEPQLELQGSMAFPTSFGTVSGGGAVTFAVADPEKFILNESGLTLTGGSISIPAVHFNLLNLVKVAGQSLKVQYLSSPTASLRVSGIVKVPQLYNLELNFNPAQGRFIQFDSAGNVSVNGVLSVRDVVIVRNLWVIKQASFAFNNTGQQNVFQVNATLQIPSGAQVGGTISFVGGDLDSISLFGENLRIPLGATGLFLQRIEGGLQNLANPTGNPPLRFHGALGLSFGPRIDIHLPSIVGGGTLSGSLVDLTVQGTIDRHSLSVNGDVAIVGNSRPAPASGLITGSAALTLNWSRGTFQGDWQVSTLGGLFSANVRVQANSYGTFGFIGTGTGRLPSGFPFYGLQLPSADGALYFTNNNDYSDDFVACWGSITKFGYTLTKGIKIFFDGNYQIINSEVVLPPIVTGEERGEFDIHAGTARYLVTADWPNRAVNPQLVRVQFFDPGTSQLIDVTTPGNGLVDSVQVDQLQAGNRLFLLTGVRRSGRYVFTLVPPAGQQLGETSWTGGVPNEKPQIHITGATVAPNLSDVTIDYTAFDPEDQARITFFLDTDNTGFDGTAIQVHRNHVPAFEVPE
ncbi:MAG: hypothetical protein RMJ35_09375, partial [Phycisphaerales bacterium]|nr:hypothetical protein [Phycisphaerales bacterium]